MQLLMLDDNYDDGRHHGVVGWWWASAASAAALLLMRRESWMVFILFLLSCTSMPVPQSKISVLLMFDECWAGLGGWRRREARLGYANARMICIFFFLLVFFFRA